MNKYEFSGETKQFAGRTLRQIRALTEIRCGTYVVTPGMIGGWIESEENLSQTGNAWVNGNAMAFENAQIFGDAWIAVNAQVSGNAQIARNALIAENAKVFGNAQIFGNAKVLGDAQIFGNAQIAGDAQIFGNAQISGNAQIFGNSWIAEEAQISGNAKVSENTLIGGNIKISHATGYLTISPIGSRDATTIFSRCEEGMIRVRCGCFYDTIDKFADAVSKTHGDSKHGQVYKLAIELAKKQLEE